MSASVNPISTSDGARMLGMAEAELIQLINNPEMRPGDRKCIQAAFHLLEDKAVWVALKEVQTTHTMENSR